LAHELIRSKIPRRLKDREFSGDIEIVRSLIRGEEFASLTGPLLE
jgi:hypothetical protein